MREQLMNKFTVQELADFYQKLADGSRIDYALLPKDMFGHPENGPHLGCSKDVWRIKPTHKVIDLSVLIETGIDVELGDFQGVFFLGGHLTHIIEKGSSSMYNASDSTNAHSYARPRMNHKHAWFSGNCPLPEGFVVEVWYRDGLRLPDNLMNSGIYNKTGWIHKNIGRDIIAFEVLGIADGYVMPWEQNDE